MRNWYAARACKSWTSGRRPRGGLQENGRLEAPAGVGQGLGEPDPHRRVLGVGGGPQLEDAAVELRGAVEGEGLDRGCGRLRVVPAGLRRLGGRLEVDRQGLGVGPPGLLQLAGEQAMPGHPVPRREPPRHRLADAVVIGLDLVGRIRAGAPDEVVRPQQGQRREPVGAQPGGAAGGA
ncbi:MAG: hypothetical protein WKF75_00555 [Singulisphaera sp.]